MFSKVRARKIIDRVVTNCVYLRSALKYRPSSELIFLFLFSSIFLCADLAAQEIFPGPKFDPITLSLKGEQDSNPGAIAITDLVVRRHFLGASISPDGRYFSYAAVQAHIADNSHRTALVLAEVRDPSRIRILGSAGRPRWNYVGEYFQEAPQWSPDSQYVTYTIQNRGARQIWLWPVDGGLGKQLTRSKLDVLNYRWLPDGSGLIYSTRRNSLNTDDPPANDPVLYGETTQGNYGTPLLDRNKVNSPEISLWNYNLRTKSSRTATDREIEAFASTFKSPFQGNPGQDLRLSPNGQLVVEFVSVPNEKKTSSDVNYLVFKDRSTGRVVSKSDDMRSSPTVATWKPDNRTVLVYWSQRFGAQGLYEASVEDGKLRPVLEASSEFVSRCSFTSRVDRAVCFSETPMKLKSLVLLDLQARTAHTIADINPEFHSLRLGKPTLMSWTNKYGDEKHGWVILPVDYVEGKRYPLLLTSYYFPGTFLNGMGDEFPLQIFANNGFVVACVHTPPERRRDQGFENALLDWESPTASFETLIKILDEKGMIDPQRVGIMGLSYGAELTEYAISHSKSFSAAASTSAGSHDPGKMYTSDKAARDYYYGPKIGLMGWWEGDIYADRWARYSTFLNATNIRGPWLIQAVDREFMPAVPLFNRLRELRKSIELWVYPNEFHVKNQPRDQFLAQDRYLDWFRFWLKDEENSNPAKTEQYKRWRELRKLQEQNAKSK